MGLQAVFSCNTEYQLILVFGIKLTAFETTMIDSFEQKIVAGIFRVEHLGKGRPVPKLAGDIYIGPGRLLDSLNAFFVVKGNDLTHEPIAVFFLYDNTKRPKTLMLRLIVRPDVVCPGTF